MPPVDGNMGLRPDEKRVPGPRFLLTALLILVGLCVLGVVVIKGQQDLMEQPPLESADPGPASPSYP